MGKGTVTPGRTFAGATLAGLLVGGVFSAAAVLGVVPRLVPVGRAVARQPMCSKLDEVHAAAKDSLDVFVFFRPGTSTAVLDRAAETMRADPRVERVEVLDQSAAYDEFLKLFEDKPQLRAGVDAASLPPSVRADVRASDDMVSLAADWRVADAVYEVKVPGQSLARETTRPLLADAPGELRSFADAIVDGIDRMDDADAAASVQRALAALDRACGRRRS